MSYDGIINRDKVSLDLFWLRDESLEDSANLPDPHILDVCDAPLIFGQGEELSVEVSVKRDAPGFGIELSAGLDCIRPIE